MEMTTTSTEISNGLLTKEQVADYLSVSTVTIWRYMNRKENPLPHFKMGRLVRFKMEDVIAFVSQSESEVPE